MINDGDDVTNVAETQAKQRKDLPTIIFECALLALLAALVVCFSCYCRYRAIQQLQTNAQASAFKLSS